MPFSGCFPRYPPSEQLIYQDFPRHFPPLISQGRHYHKTPWIQSEIPTEDNILFSHRLHTLTIQRKEWCIRVVLYDFLSYRFQCGVIKEILLAVMLPLYHFFIPSMNQLIYKSSISVIYMLHISLLFRKHLPPIPITRTFLIILPLPTDSRKAAMPYVLIAAGIAVIRTFYLTS